MSSFWRYMELGYCYRVRNRPRRSKCHHQKAWDKKVNRMFRHFSVSK